MDLATVLFQMLRETSAIGFMVGCSSLREGRSKFQTSDCFLSSIGTMRGAGRRLVSSLP
jgi:hypothetical protein